MPWWTNDDDEDIREGYNKDSDDNITKYHRTNSYGGDDHDHEFYDTHTGVFGYHGDDCDRKEYGDDYDNFSNNNGWYRR